MPTYFGRLDLSAYELVISSSHACAVNVHPRPEALHLCYCYTPMRYAWLAQMERGRARGLKGLALAAVTSRLRRMDAAAARRPHGYAAISTAVRDRVRAFYGRDARVIHPPVDVADLDPTHAKEPGHFLWVHRLVPYKRPEVVAEAFRGLPYRLTMVGVGPLERRLRASLPPNVQLRAWVDRRELARLYGRAHGFLHVGEEDFGITMVEALAAGTPVIAVNRGGATDIVEHGRHGLLIEEPTVPLVREAVTALAERRWDRAELARRASEFSRERFVQRLGDYIDELGRARAA
jgi:glycosyltransferase involved in cell wall biosynthesis